MIPFIYADINSLIQSLPELILKQDVLSQCKTGIRMKQLGLCNKENLLNLKDINLGFVVLNIIAKLRRNDTVTLAEVKKFKVGTQKFMIKMIIKLLERKTLGSIFLRYATIFDLSVLFELERNLLANSMKSLLKFKIELNIMEPSRCDKASSKLHSFCDNDHKTISDKLAEFGGSSYGLDEFYFEKIGIQKYGELSFFLKLFLTLTGKPL